MQVRGSSSPLTRHHSLPAAQPWPTYLCSSPTQISKAWLACRCVLKTTGGTSASKSNDDDEAPRKARSYRLVLCEGEGLAGPSYR